MKNKKKNGKILMQAACKKQCKKKKKKNITNCKGFDLFRSETKSNLLNVYKLFRKTAFITGKRAHIACYSSRN